MKLLRLAMIFPLMFSAMSTVTFAAAFDTTGYLEIRELKAWTNQIDIYFENGEKHKCSGDSKDRFVVDSKKKHFTTFLMAAFMGQKLVSLRYICGADNYPDVAGVRVR